MITGVPMRLILSAFGFTLAGMVTGNMYMIQLGLVPLLFVFLGLVVRQPKLFAVEPQSPSISVDLGEELTITREVRVGDGMGLVTLGEELPSSFELIKGSNIQAFWKRPGAAALELRYRIRCTRRGSYTLGNIRWESRHPLGMVTTRIGSLELNQELIVKPRTLRVKRLRQQKIFTKIPMPAESRIQMGVPTTDFKELRDYSFGDSYKQINWKATARKQRSSLPTVNEYEKEGRQLVYVFLDTSSRMGAGTTISNSFEYAIQAALGLSEFYISRECKVGLSLFNSEPPESVRGMETERTPRQVFPDGGRVQQYRIHKLLLEAELSISQISLKEAVMYARGHVIGTNPLFVVVTWVCDENIGRLMDGARELSRYIKNRRQRPNILMVNVSGYELVAGGERAAQAVQLIEFKEIHLISRLRGMGLMVVNWYPLTQSITEVLLSQVRGA